MAKLIIIAGPTGIGKTSAAVKMACEFNGEIIGADSMQIYQYMSIGTAKPKPEELQGVAHHLIDFIAPDAHFDAAEFSRVARQAISAVIKRGRVPFLVGGTGLYIKTAVSGIFRDEAANPELRRRLRELEKTAGISAVYEELKQIDPETAALIHPHDRYRILRAIEVFHQTGKSIRTHQQEHQFSENPYRQLKIGFTMERKALYERIERRVDEMLAAGLADEVRQLLNSGYSPELKSMQSIGYRQMVQYLSGELAWAEAVRLIKRDTRRYAKRQLTWFKADPDMIWLAPEALSRLRSLIAEFLTLDNPSGFQGLE